jgi:hypothetical protein
VTMQTDHLEERLRDALYTTVGLSVMAYHAAKPYRTRLSRHVEDALHKHGQCNAELFAMATKATEAAWNQLCHDFACREQNRRQ